MSTLTDGVRTFGTMRRVLVAGATGYLGAYVAQELKARRHFVRALARSPEKLDHFRGAVDEIVHLRTSGKPFAFLGKQINEAIGAEVDGTEAVTIYRRNELETDLAIHISWQKGPEGKGPSSLGLHLAAALREYGLVEHTLWHELK